MYKYFPASMSPPFCTETSKNMFYKMFNQSSDCYLEFASFAQTTFSDYVQKQQELMKLYFNLIPLTAFTHQTQQAENVRFSETGDVALVTGGIGGIGTQICRRLYNDGNQIIATYVPQEKEQALVWKQALDAEGINIQIVECNVANFDFCDKTVKDLLRQVRHIDILVNCAGITRDATLKNMSPEDWHAVLDTNLDSIFNMTKPVIASMQKRKYGRIINISSINGQRGQFGQTNYSASKAGMFGFARALAEELKDSGITVNSVAPGYTETKMVNSVPEKVMQQIVSKIPMKRLATPDEIADAVSFLANRRCGYITGSILPVNGGMFMSQ